MPSSAEEIEKQVHGDRKIKYIFETRKIIRILQIQKRCSKIRKKNLSKKKLKPKISSLKIKTVETNQKKNEFI